MELIATHIYYLLLSKVCVITVHNNCYNSLYRIKMINVKKVRIFIVHICVSSGFYRGFSEKLFFTITTNNITIALDVRPRCGSVS